jgi:Holliday junction DNA helicase RuvA
VIASLSGTIIRSTPGEVVIEVGGVGYLVRVPMSTFVGLPPVDGAVRLSIVTIIREDEFSLYGFLTLGEENLFKLLQSVTGVGPKLALKIISGLDPLRLRNALIEGDLAMLTTISGVGKKVAERLVVELRDKAADVKGLDGAKPVELPKGVKALSEAIDALCGLGYPAKTATQAVESVSDQELSIEETIRAALKYLAPKR